MSNPYPDQDLFSVVSYEKRVSEIKSLLKWSVINVLLTFYVLNIIFIYYSYWDLKDH